MKKIPEYRWMRTLLLFAVLSLVCTTLGCAENKAATATENISTVNTATPENYPPLQNLSFYMNDSEYFSTGETDEYNHDFSVRRFYVEDLAWVGSGGRYDVPAIALTFKNKGESVTKVFRLHAETLEQMDFAKGRVLELRLAFSKSNYCESCTLIEYDRNGTNPHRRPYA
jgi:hypothetical protein